MRFAGIDIGGERHAVAVVNDDGALLVRSALFGEEAAGYQRLRELLGDPDDCLVTIEATGHYWRNLFTFLIGQGFKVALLNPLRTRRFAEEELERTRAETARSPSATAWSNRLCIRVASPRDAKLAPSGAEATA
jgi:transposase